MHVSRQIVRLVCRHRLRPKRDGLVRERHLHVMAPKTRVSPIFDEAQSTTHASRLCSPKGVIGSGVWAKMPLSEWRPVATLLSAASLDGEEDIAQHT